jgi:hypothetical protein
VNSMIDWGEKAEISHQIIPNGSLVYLLVIEQREKRTCMRSFSFWALQRRARFTALAWRVNLLLSCGILIERTEVGWM